MNAEDAKQQLREEGFDSVFVVNDRPGRVYDDHTHGGVTAHIVLDGSIEVEVEGEKSVYEKGDRFDVPAEAVHNARIGKDGCKYVVGEK